MLEITEASKNLGSAKRIGYLNDIFGARAAPGMISMLSDAEKIKPYIDILEKSQGAAARTAKIMDDNVKGQIDELTSSWEDLNIALFETGKANLTGLLRWVTGLIEAASRFVTENPKLVSSILNTLAVLLSMRVGFLLGSYAISLLITPQPFPARMLRSCYSARADWPPSRRN